MLGQKRGKLKDVVHVEHSFLHGKKKGGEREAKLKDSEARIRVNWTGGVQTDTNTGRNFSHVGFLHAGTQRKETEGGGKGLP